MRRHPILPSWSARWPTRRRRGTTGFRAALQATFGEAEGRAAARRWRDWFPPIYRDSYDAGQAVTDIEPLQALLDGKPFGVQLGRRAGLPPHRFAVRLFHPRKPIALSDILPLAENLGLRVLSETPFLLQAPGSDGIAMQVLRVETADKTAVDLAAVGRALPTRSIVCGRGRWRTTGSTSWC